MMKAVTKLLFFLFISSCAVAQVPSNLELTDIFNMEFVSDPQISPDGTKIIYVRNFKDIMTIKIYPTCGSQILMVPKTAR